MRPVSIALSLLFLAGCHCGTRLANVPDGLTVDPEALAFGTHFPGDTQSKTVTLTNGGKVDLTLSARLDGDARGAYSIAVTEVQLPVGAAVQLTVTFIAGQVPGDDVGALLLEGSLGTVEIPLSAQVVALLEPTGTGGGAGGAGGGAGAPACPGGVAELACGNGTDDDCDGKADCADSDCAGVGPCAQPACDATGELRVSTLPAGASSSTAPDVAWNGSEFLVSWITALGSGADLSLARVSSNGALLSGPTPVTTGGTAAHPPRLSVAGADFVVGFSGTLGATAQTALLQYVTAQGTLSGAPLALGTGWPVTVAARPGSAELGVLWGAHNTVGNRPSFTAVSARARNGADHTVSATSGNTDYGDLAWNGSGWAVVWTDLRMGQSNAYFALLDAQGYALGGEVKLSSGAGTVYQPRLAWTGTEYGVSWSEASGNTQNVFFTRVSSTGIPLGAPQQVTQSAARASSADLAFTGTRFAIVYMDDATGQPWLGHGYLQLLDPLGNLVGAPRRLDCGAGGSGHRPAVTWNGSALAVAWGDSRNGALDVYFRLLVP
jgi:hypothetical protein